MQDVAFRRPYEILLLCKPCETEPKAALDQSSPAVASPMPIDGTGNLSGAASRGVQPTEGAAAGVPAVEPLPQLPQQLVFCAVAGCHSRKPHVGRLLRKHCPANPRCLEVCLQYHMVLLLPDNEQARYIGG